MRIFGGVARHRITPLSLIAESLKSLAVAGLRFGGVEETDPSFAGEGTRTLKNVRNIPLILRPRAYSRYSHKTVLLGCIILNIHAGGC